MRAVVALAVVVAACGTSVDPAGLPSIDGYKTWAVLERDGDVPGHGATFRLIYVNPIGRGYPHGGSIPIGAVAVKEVYGDMSHTDLHAIEIQRYVGDDANVDAPVDGGWVFTSKNTADDGETYHGTCWACHRQAPYAGAFVDLAEPVQP
jgi:hypothetical protein